MCGHDALAIDGALSWIKHAQRQASIMNSCLQGGPHEIDYMVCVPPHGDGLSRRAGPGAPGRERSGLVVVHGTADEARRAHELLTDASAKTVHTHARAERRANPNR